MECFGTTGFDNNSRLITLTAIIISGLHCPCVTWQGIGYKLPENDTIMSQNIHKCDNLLSNSEFVGHT
jgi:hypothetical protein